MQKKSLLRLAAPILAAAVLVPTAGGATASVPTETNYETVKAEAVQSLLSTGVAKSDAPRLAEKWLQDGELDSLDATAEPVDKKVVKTDGKRIKSMTFADGSIRTEEFQTPTASESIMPNASPMGIGHCSATTGSWGALYEHCLVKQSYGVVTASFRSTYTLVNGGDDQINHVWDPYVQVVGGTYKNPVLKVDQKQENYRMAATASLRFTINSYGDSSSTSAWLKLQVGGDKAVLAYTM